MKNSPQDLHASNFGEAPRPYLRTKQPQLDSVIFVSDSVAIMVTSCKKLKAGEKMAADWKPGRDTVYNHYLFSLKHKLDYIKRELEDAFYFGNDINRVKFIGYDNEDLLDKNENIFSPVIPHNDNFPPIFPAIFVMAILSVVSIHIYKRKRQSHSPRSLS